MKNTEPTFVVHNANCLDILKTMEDNSIDSICTDPPYGLNMMNKGWDKVLPDPAIWKECLRVLKPGGHMVAFGAPRLYHRLACSIEDQGFEVRDSLMWVFGSGFPKSLDIGKALPEEESAQGIGTALKPAYEPIILARKPLEGTVASNVLKWGTGGINIDGCRIETTENLNGGAYAKTQSERHDGDESWRMKPGQAGDFVQPAGRFPANLILDEEAGKLLDEQSGILKTGAAKPFVGEVKESASIGKKRSMLKGHSSNEGGTSRFFYCAKASKKEREAGLESMPSKKVSDGRTKTNNSPRLRDATERKNTHPTVKPISLMQWLVRLITPPGGIVLDPFTGSGSTGCAAMKEGFDFIGCDLSAEYVEIANKRIEHARPKQQEV